MRALPPGGTPARIGPNAVNRLAEALHARHGPAVAAEVFGAAGVARHLRQPPTGMVDEAEVARLHRALRDRLAGGEAASVARDAGQRTADYLLAHRIPAAVQGLLKRLPAPWAARVLLAAIGRHAWTFAGSGRFEARAGHPVVLTIRGNPLCTGVSSPVPVCDFYAATFERLFRVLVHRDTRVSETACEAQGAPACRFELRWR